MGRVKTSLSKCCLYFGIVFLFLYAISLHSSMEMAKASSRPRMGSLTQNGTITSRFRWKNRLHSHPAQKIHLTNCCDHRPIVMLKLPRTGSTWLTDILNSFKEIYIAKEIVQHQDVGMYSDSEVENHLLGALRFPADRISNSKSYLPSMHYIEEFVKTYKFTVRLKLLGFSVNPEHIHDTVLPKILEKVPKAEMIVLKRRNIVKLAISAATGRNVKARTGLANLRASELQVHDSDYRLNWNLTVFMNEYYSAKARYTTFLESINRLNVTVHTIYYEDMQIDLENALDDLIASFGYYNLVWPDRVKHAAAALFNESETNAMAVRKRSDVPKIERQKSMWKKRTPESLSNVLVNYNYLHETIRRKSGKHGLSDKYVGYPISALELKCILEQLESEEPAKSFSKCPVL